MIPALMASEAKRIAAAISRLMVRLRISAWFMVFYLSAVSLRASAAFWTRFFSLDLVFSPDSENSSRDSFGERLCGESSEFDACLFAHVDDVCIDVLDCFIEALCGGHESLCWRLLRRLLGDLRQSILRAFLRRCPALIRAADVASGHFVFLQGGLQRHVGS